MSNGRKIHPIVIYPFHQPEKPKHIGELYRWLRQNLDPDECEQPTTVVNMQTYLRNRKSESFLNEYENASQQSGKVLRAWCVDTCQMWLTGLGDALESAESAGKESDVFWLIPGDFNYASGAGEKTLERMLQIPRAIRNNDSKLKLSIGQIETSRDDSKELIDTYSTHCLLSNWFPAEADILRKSNVTKPRTEFFAIKQEFLRDAMVNERWYPYEQTLVLLLLALDEISGRGKFDDVVHVEELSDIRDFQDNSVTRDTPSAALQQVERTERVLKNFWRERKKKEKKAWRDEFDALSSKSAQIVNSALVIFSVALKQGQ